MLARRVMAMAILVLLMLPWYRLVGLRGEGPAAEQTLRLGSAYLSALWVGTLLALVCAWLLTRLTRRARPTALFHRLGTALLAPSTSRYGLGLGAVAAAAALWVGMVVLDGHPALLDGVAQLLQARYFAAGMPGAPALRDPTFWQFQFMVATDHGWVSQYPPGYPAALAVALKLGGAWLLGPLLLGLTVWLMAFVAERLFPDERVVARLGVGLMALSPFLAFHAGAYMSHTLALMLLTVVVLASLRSMDGSWLWSLPGGAALGALLATRPYTAVVLGLVATLGVWTGAPRRGSLTSLGWAARVGATAAAAAPFVAALMLYNRRWFGAPTRFGYTAVAGPSHGVGFHVDPWGDAYGVAEAIGYTSADLQGLSVDLLRSPIPLLALVCLYLFFAQGLSRGARVAAAWALCPVLAQAFYWHHDLFMGPRLLYEAIPGWSLLLAASVIWLLRALPNEASADGRTPAISRDGVGAMLLLALMVGVGYTAPRKLASYGPTGVRAGMQFEAGNTGRPALVFVHGTWESRLAARLAAFGMRVDSIRMTLRHNSTCQVEQYLGRIEAGPSSPRQRAADSQLAFTSGDADLREAYMPSGSVIRTLEGETLLPECERQAASDFQGVFGLPALLIEGDLPGLGFTGAMFVRDMGPERNARLLDRFPAREPAVLLRRGDVVRRVPYEVGMAELWSAPLKSPAAPP